MKIDYYAKFTETIEADEEAVALLKSKEGKAQLADLLRVCTGAEEVSITRVNAEEAKA